VVASWVHASAKEMRIAVEDGRSKGKHLQDISPRTVVAAYL
jgi:hypothetical protein